MGEKLSEWFLKNPLAWVLLLLLVIAEHGNYTTGKDLDRVCALLGAHNGVSIPPQTTREEIDNICLAHDPDQADSSGD